MKALKIALKVLPIQLFFIAALAALGQQIQREPLDVNEIVRQLGLCKANETLNQNYIAKLQARIRELETPKAGAVPKLPEGK